MDLLVLCALSLAQAAVIALGVLVPAAWALDRGWDDATSLAIGLVGFALVGWIGFFVYWANPVLGDGFKLLILAGGAWVLFRQWRVGLLRRTVWPDLVVISAIIPVVLVLMLWAFAGSDLSEPLLTAASRWILDLPIDNALPLYFAEHLREGSVPSPLIGDWLSSDRPPLQTGLFLIFGLPFAGDLVYQATATALQVLVVPGSYLLTRTLGGDRAMSAVAAALVMFAPFALVNSIYVWPKLLPAALLCATAAILLSPRFASYRQSWKLGAVAGAAGALALGGHGVSAFVIAAFAGVVLVLHRLPRLGFLMAGVAAAALIYLPWVAYQNFADPPGNRLVKWHIAGVIAPDDRSLPEALAASFNEVSVWGWYQGRKANIEMITGPTPRLVELAGTVVVAAGPEAREGAAREIRIYQFVNWAPSLGMLSWLLLCSPLLLLHASTRVVTLAVWAALFVWTVSMFAPGSTMVHQGSLWPQIALLVGFVVASGRLHRAIPVVALVVQAVGAILIFGVFA
jgi:hypothetical protein